MDENRKGRRARAQEDDAEGIIGSQQAVLVSPRQQGNPLLKQIVNVPWKVGQVQADFVFSDSSCALFLSLRYHLLHPDYLYSRIAQVKRDFRVRVVLCLVDIQNCTEPLILLNSLASANEFTVVLCWSLPECARYIETFKAYDKKAAGTALKTKLETSYLPRLEDALTTIRSINRADVKSLSQNVGSLKSIVNASMEELALCPGVGDKKVRRLIHCFNEPFLSPE